MRERAVPIRGVIVELVDDVLQFVVLRAPLFALEDSFDASESRGAAGFLVASATVEPCRR
ncbi:MAG: hypothetical protein WDZ65_09135 [Aquisalimonadaceae bacterium]